MQVWIVARLAVLSWLIGSVPVAAKSYLFPINIRDEPVATSLNDLARQTGIEIVYDRSLLGDRRSQALQGKLPVDVVLQRILSGTGLSARRAASGAWIVERQLAPGAPPPADLAAPEILVVGRHSQDADIRRRENDVQPYHVVTGEEITVAHRDNLDQFFQSRITDNTAIGSPALAQTGDTNSQIDLRGLGTTETLVLVDGRRLPGVPGGGVGFGQPDLNAIPLHAIERVETLTGTAGGIYGLGALGGVVNVILRHNYHGLEVHATGGIDARGDARRLNLEAGLGFTPDNGRTDVSVYVSHAWQQPLLAGQTNLVKRGVALHERYSPSDYSSAAPGNDSVVVSSVAGDPLVLKPGYGGTSLGSSYSYVPQGFAGTQASLAAALQHNAGQVDLGQSLAARESDLASTPTTTSATLDIRHHFDGGVEAYFDAFFLRNSGRYEDIDQRSDVLLSPASPLNLFQNTVEVDFQAPSTAERDHVSYSSDRATVGAIIPLAWNWRANPEATFGSSRYRDDYTVGYLDALDFNGVNCSAVDPFGDASALGQSVASCRHAYVSSQKAVNHYREQSLRLAGPLFRIAKDPATLTVLAQNRSEAVPPNRVISYFDDPALGGANTAPYPVGGISTITRSIYAELAAPMIRDDAPIPIFKGLALQVAIRHDWQRLRYVSGYFGGLLASDDPIRQQVDLSGTMYTVGAKLYPLPWLMLRGSYATGQQPPPPENLQQVSYSSYVAELVDPKRGGIQPFNSDQYTELVGGLTPKKVHANTYSLGAVFNPESERGPRLSIDYSRTHESGIYADPDLNLILANEDLWPQRVIRAPLTDADRALGYTGGAIMQIDARGLSVADVDVTSIDARLDWHMPFADGMLRAYGGVTRQLRNRQAGAVVDRTQWDGFVDGPLKWRANAGAEWTKGRTTLGANLQYFSSYRIVGAEYLAFTAVAEDPQGSKFVKAQAYLDISASRRFQTYWAGAGHIVILDLGIVNVLDHAPPYQAYSSGPQYSPYGDPRQRRFEFTLNTQF